MNVKHSLSASRKLLLALGAVLCAQTVLAQGVARLTGSFTSGEFRAPSEAQTLWQAGAEAEGRREWTDLSLHGHFGFTQAYGTGMCGSMFTEPGYYPVDVVEFTPGSKSRQTYDIGGGLSWKKLGSWIPGIDTRFRGVNLAKRKDLRHTTYRQELALSPSLAYEGDGWLARLSYSFGKTSEFIQAEVVGPPKAESYYAFLDKGLRYGTYQAWDGSGVHLAEPGVDRFPVNERSHGVSLEVEAPFGLEASFGITFGNGEVGEKGYTWFRFPSLQWEGEAVWQFTAGRYSHRLQAHIGWQSRQLYERVIEKVNSGGVTTPSILGENRVYAERGLEGGISYRLERKDGLALEVLARSEAGNKQSTLMYPFWDLDRATHCHLGLGAEIPLGAFLIKTGGLVSGNIFGHRHTVDTDDDQLGVSSRPFQLAEWYDMENELDDALHAQFSLAVRYNFNPFYLEAGCDWTHAFRVEVLPGANRQTTHLVFGYNF